MKLFILFPISNLKSLPRSPVCYVSEHLVDYSIRERYNNFSEGAHSSIRIERLPSKQRVAGSNPAGRAIWADSSVR